MGFEDEAEQSVNRLAVEERLVQADIRTHLIHRPARDIFPPLGIGLALWVACDDADKLHDLIIARGGAILSPPVDGPFGRFFVARDPDGYAITFHTSRKA
jgi:hypothetical protein